MFSHSFLSHITFCFSHLYVRIFFHSFFFGIYLFQRNLACVCVRARVQRVPIYFACHFLFHFLLRLRKNEKHHVTQVGIISKSATAANFSVRRWWYSWMDSISFRSNAFWNTAGCRCTTIGHWQRFSTSIGMGRCKLIQFIICLSQMSSVKCHKFIQLNSQCFYVIHNILYCNASLSPSLPMLLLLSTYI